MKPASLGMGQAVKKDGFVLDGKPVRDEDTAGEFHGQVTERTTRRWRQCLVKFGYISQKRTPSGYVIQVQWTQLPESERPKMADHSGNPKSELPNHAITPGSELPKRAVTEIQKSELPNVADLSARNARSELPDVADHSRVPDVPSEPQSKPLEFPEKYLAGELSAVGAARSEELVIDVEMELLSQFPEAWDTAVAA